VSGLVVFSFLAQYIVPELTRGYSSNKDDIKKLPKAIVLGMAITATLLAIVPLAAIGIIGPDKVTEVVTISWADAIGEWAFLVANGFALLAMMTSFCGIGQSFMTNIFDAFRYPSECDVK